MYKTNHKQCFLYLPPVDHCKLTQSDTKVPDPNRHKHHNHYILFTPWTHIEINHRDLIIQLSLVNKSRGQKE